MSQHTSVQKKVVSFADFGLSILGVITGSVLLIYGLRFIKYIAGDCGFGTLAFYVIVGVEIGWLFLTKIIAIVWPKMILDKLGLWKLSTMCFSFIRGFVFSIIYILLWILNEHVPDYLNYWVNPYPLSSQKIGSFKVDLSPVNAAVGTEGARRATGVPTATPYTSAGLR